MGEAYSSSVLFSHQIINKKEIEWLGFYMVYNVILKVVPLMT